MNNQEKSSNTRLNDNNLEKVTGGFIRENRFQCSFCQHSPFNTNTELINHIQVKHRSKIDTD